MSAGAEYWMSAQFESDHDKRRPVVASLIVAAVVGAVFGALATGFTGFGLSALWSTSPGAMSGGAIVGAAVVLAACLMWNLEARAVGRRLDRVLEGEIEAGLDDNSRALDRADKLAALLSGTGRTDTRGDRWPRRPS